MNLIFDKFPVSFRTIFKFNVSKKFNLHGIKGILMDFFYYSSSKHIKLHKAVDFKTDKLLSSLNPVKRTFGQVRRGIASITRNGEYLKVLS